jgi:GGDEF domain-containing protein
MSGAAILHILASVSGRGGPRVRIVVKGCFEMQQRPPRRRRARPVADAPIDSLLLRADELTKGWLLALVEQEPLGEAPAILAAELTRDGPRLCDALVRALANDDDLGRLEPGGALELLAGRAGELAGARGAEAISRAVDALGAVIWSGVRGALADPDPEQVTELAERLSLVIEQVRGAALRRLARQTPAEEPVLPTAPPPLLHAVDDAPSELEHSGPPDQDIWPPAPVPPDAAGPSSLWVHALEEEIDRARSTGTPLSLLLIELEDAQLMLAADGVDEAAATFSSFAQAVRGVMRRQDILACETEARAWVIARDTARRGAHSLGDRIVGAVQATHRWRGAPLGVSVGLAVLGEDGPDAGGLIGAAEEAMFAAAASGSGVAEGSPSRDPGEGPTGPRLVS